MASDPIADTTGAPAGKVVAATRQGACGSLNLRFRLAYSGCDSRTVVDTVEQQPPLRLIRAFSQANGAALVFAQYFGGVLGGDQLSVSAYIESGARAQITTTGATRCLSPPCGPHRCPAGHAFHHWRWRISGISARSIDSLRRLPLSPGPSFFLKRMQVSLPGTSLHRGERRAVNVFSMNS